MRAATAKDFKIGTVLTDNYDSSIKFIILRKEQEGIWLARGNSGETCVFEVEAACYLVNE